MVKSRGWLRSSIVAGYSALSCGWCLIAAAQTDQSSSVTQLQEVVVTAQKREERLQDVPVPVTAISGESLVQNNQLLVRDYFASVPGLSFVSSGYGNTVTVRGIAAGTTIPAATRPSAP